MALTEACLPIGARQAARIGLLDDVIAGAPSPFDRAALARAEQLARSDDYERRLDRKRAARADDERPKPLEAYRVEELAEMSRDIFDDRRGFAAARHAFVTKQKPRRRRPAWPRIGARHRPRW